VGRPFFVVAAALLAAGGLLPAAGLAGCSDVRWPRGTDGAPADTTTGEVRFRMAGPGGAAIVVPVSVDGHDPVDLILDTGATLTCVDTALARAWALPEQRMAVGMAVGIGAAGRVRLHTADSLRVGTTSARRVTVCSMDLQALRAVGSDVRGLLGLNVLRNYRVTLDFERRVLQLAPPRS
jgi:predicted aspartyl protease